MNRHSDLLDAPIATTNGNPVNVSSVPQRSVFRYPGGKTWLVPQLRAWLKSLPKRPKLLVEPFVGGGIISLTAAFENLADEVLMVELDQDVAAVWQTIVAGEGDKLGRKILNFELTRESLMEELQRTPTDTLHRAFQTILKNRTFHGGILAKGSGTLKHGDGKGVLSRWYPVTLAKRFQAIDLVRSKLRFVHGDAFDVIREYSDRKTAAWFIDPPYSAGKGKRAGSRLYTHWELDHAGLFDAVGKVAGDFLMTYDNADDVREMAVSRGFATQTVAMTGTHHNHTLELLIGRDLDWVL